ncbi:MAG: hypothetical protein WBZ37_27835 [Mycobacterium sp.]
MTETPRKNVPAWGSRISQMNVLESVETVRTTAIEASCSAA